ncbi:hypothetical protein BGZ61DRAFT_463611 [Ilyonectria robusta]|uniref:uncharacterized protein n=1 Tax=Ilyonectria robusta TaxID=1079257 RepID=UPI001E8E9B6B|nr:uncharacterized protein BGZ61DRAFT_463611 [Ilyonectria robusta]KAH8661766.1 hypothetical protein BGZ61DRAFT_463611 [Ilyonectria robusta]
MRGTPHHRNTRRKLSPHSLIDFLSSWQQPTKGVTTHPTETPSSQCQIRAQSRPCENLVFWKPHPSPLSEWDQSATTLSATKTKELWRCPQICWTCGPIHRTRPARLRHGLCGRPACMSPERYSLNFPRWTHLSCRAASSRNSCKRAPRRVTDSAGYRR